MTATPRPKTGEPRAVQQPLKIDLLPQSIHDEILKRKAKGKTWGELEKMSPQFAGWKDAEPEVELLFPGRRLPHTNLRRWYDLRVEQVRKEVLAETESARQFAAAFADRSFDDLPEAVLNALRDQVFSLVRSGGDQKRFMGALSDFGWLVAQFKKVEIQQQKVGAEGRRVKLLEEQWARKKKQLDRITNEAATKVGKGKNVTLTDINLIRERTFGLPPIKPGDSASHSA